MTRLRYDGPAQPDRAAAASDDGSRAMKVLLFGASGMVGQGVLRECLAAADVTAVVSVVRAPTGVRHPKLRELVLADLARLEAVEAELRGCAACFLCIGVSSFGMAADAYERVTYDLTLALARAVVRLNPGLTLVYVSGAGTDSSERGRSRWARVKGRTENALLALPCNAYMFRPAGIRPVDGVVSKTALYRAFYWVTKPLLPLLGPLLPRYLTTTRQMGRAMLAVARHGASQRVLDTADINAL
jgi:hypothetical protein